MTDKQIEYGFWHWDRENNFPPDSITYPNEYKGQRFVNIACTQLTALSVTEQKKLIKEWIDFLPSCQNIEMLWFSTLTTQQLFESVCKLENLVGLYIKWSNIKNLESLSALSNLKYLRIGSSSKIESILPLSRMIQLEVLQLESFKKISDFSPLSDLANLKFFSIEGGMYMKQKVDTFEPFSKLTNLIYFSALMINCSDKRIDTLMSLKKLKTINWPFDLKSSDMERLKDELPNLIYLPHRNVERNAEMLKAMKFGK
jgi:hypothetical protein